MICCSHRPVGGRNEQIKSERLIEPWLQHSCLFVSIRGYFLYAGTSDNSGGSRSPSSSVQRQTSGRDDARGDEDNEIFLDMLIDIRAKRSPNERNVPNDGNLIFCFLHVFTHQPAFNASFVGANQRGRHPREK